MRLGWTASYETIGPSAQDASDTADMRVTVKATRAQAELIYLFVPAIEIQKSQKQANIPIQLHPSAHQQSKVSRNASDKYQTFSTPARECLPSPLSQVNGEFVLNFICTASQKNVHVNGALGSRVAGYVLAFLPLHVGELPMRNEDIDATT